ncbi:MAG: ATP-dependent sacrificial sulfur transferase LarE [Planctomycetes bacterium]|nr:ATP-dependent sacrificial sulfur transferase LarE [Planctomycetota bacterium]
MSAYAEKLARLERALGELPSLAVAFSGGVDSGVLLHAARARLGAGAAGVIADSPSLPRQELAEARALAAQIGARLVVLATHELDDPRYRANSGDRCYHCKSALFAALLPWARAQGFAHVAFGEIADDLLDDRPGARAARERGVRAPLAEAGFTKDDVRRYAREHGLRVADKPASACLASRLPVGTAVTRERLARVEAAESQLRRLGFRVLRVRDHGSLARVELGRDELARGQRERAGLEAAVRAAGFSAVEVTAYVPPAERAAAPGNPLG